MRDEYMSTGQGFILVYSITDDSSFQECEDIYEQILRTKDADEVPCVLIGNKCDLEDSRVVSKAEGQKLGEKFGSFTTFIEGSAKAGINVEEAFNSVAKQINRAEGRTVEQEPTKDAPVNPANSTGNNAPKEKKGKNYMGNYKALFRGSKPNASKTRRNAPTAQMCNLM